MSTSSNRLVKLSPTAASASRVPGDAPPGNGSRRRRYAASGKTLALSCLLSFVAWIPIASVQANERLDLLTASKQIEIASNDIQFEAAQATFFQLVVGTPCEKAVNDYLNMDFSIQLNVRLFTQGHMTFDQLKDAIKSLVDNYGRLEHVAEQIA